MAGTETLKLNEQLMLEEMGTYQNISGGTGSAPGAICATFDSRVHRWRSSCLVFLFVSCTGDRASGVRLAYQRDHVLHL